MSGKVLSWRLIDSTGCLGVVVGIHSVLRSVRGAAFRLNRTIVSVLRFSSCLASLICSNSISGATAARRDVNWDPLRCGVCPCDQSGSFDRGGGGVDIFCGHPDVFMIRLIPLALKASRVSAKKHETSKNNHYLVILQHGRSLKCQVAQGHANKLGL